MPKFNDPKLYGWIGMFLVQFATLPASAMVLLGLIKSTPPLVVIIPIVLALISFMIRSFLQKDPLAVMNYTASATVNCVLLLKILLGV